MLTGEFEDDGFAVGVSEVEAVFIDFPSMLRLRQ